MDDRGRATSLPEMLERMAPFVSDESYAAGLAFRPRPTDVIIAPYAKCGTTWLQQMVHSLRTGGDLDFDDVSRVVPWIETAHDLDLDLDAEQRGEPRAFKSHLAWDQVPKGARYIVAVRDPSDALVSAYRFFEGWFFEPGTIGVEEIGRLRFLEQQNYYRHLSSWWARREDPDVLLLAYESMKDDHEGTVQRVAEFVGVVGDHHRIAVACEESSLASMKAHADRYDDLLMRRRSEVVCGLPPSLGPGKVATGEVGLGRVQLSDAFVAELDAVWTATMGAQHGLAGYGALLDALKPPLSP